MKIKQVPEDFIVKEKIRLNISEGHYAYFKLKKIRWNTIDAVGEIARRLKVKRKMVAFAGIKDRQAVTEQYISIQDGRKEAENLDIKDIELEYAGKGKERVNQSMLQGNEFIITIRDIDHKTDKKPTFVPNYFDEQRFGQGENKDAGKAIIQKDFKKACSILGLEAENNDFLGALKRERRELLSLYVHSYQSWLFNEALAEYIKLKTDKYSEIKYREGGMVFPDEQMENLSMPLINFDTEFENEKIEQIYEAILDKEGVHKNDFIIRQMPELAAMTVYRKAFFEVKDFEEIEYSEDELNEGKHKQTISFFLPKGSYATIVIKFLYGSAQ